jgi:DNA (cytosine-5)-methyltransferase 1
MLDKKLTLGSLFSGAGGFELAAERLGITPVWASEVEPFPIAVTRRHFPNVKHLGDICKINGAQAPPVDIITGGFCCQDLSVAGKQVGLHGERSGLFFEMIRIIREMLAATNGEYPKYLVFENVPGLLSSNKGADFREVMDEISRLGFVADANILDAQEFGVAQRRKRVFIACINRKFYNAADFADVPNARDKRMQKALENFGGERFHGVASRPHEIVRQHLSDILEHDVDVRYYLTVLACLGILRRVDNKGKEIPQLLRSALESQAELVSNIRNKLGGEPFAFEPGILGRLGRLGSENLSPTLRAHMGDNMTAVAIPLDLRNAVRNSEKGDNCGLGVGENGEPSYTITSEFQGAIACKIDSPEPLAVENHLQDFRLKITGDVVQSICRNAGGGGQNVALLLEPTSYAIQGNIIGRKLENGANGKGVNEEISFTLTEADRHAVCYADVAPTLTSELAHQNGNGIMTGGGAVVEEVAAYSLTTGSFAKSIKETASPLCARDFKDVQVVGCPSFGIDRAAYNQGANALYKPQIDVESTHALTAQGPGAVAAPLEGDGRPNYVVRRLTPTECLVLMDLPRDWCADLGIENPTDGDIEFWTEIFETHRKINGKNPNPKSKNQLLKWLKNPYSDSACYKMAGNGLVVSVAEFVLAGLIVR